MGGRKGRINECQFSTQEKQAVLVALSKTPTPKNHNDAEYLRSIIKKLKLEVESELKKRGGC